LRDKLTLSGGLADVNFEAGTENVEKELIRVIDHEANKAMFQAKKNGKNQIVIFQNKSAEKEENLTNQVA
jgi:PleD family two-component response regulator